MAQKSNLRMRRRQPFWTRTKLWIAAAAGLVCVAAVVLLLVLSEHTVEVGKGSMTFTSADKGILIRKETLYKSENYGKVDFIAEEGQVVTEGTPIATVYSWNYNDDDYQALKVLEDTIMDYQQDNILKDVVLSDLSQLSQTIEEKTAFIRSVVRGEEEGDLLRLGRELQALMDERTEFLREAVTEDEQLAAFYKQEEALKAKIEEWQETTLAKENGVVSFYFDGTETLLTPANLTKLTYKNISDILNGRTFYTTDETSAGRPFYRVVTPDEWYVIVICDQNVPEFSNGMAFKVRFGDDKETTYTANVTDYREDGGKHLYTFAFREPIGKLLQARQVSMEISASYVGLLVPSGAVKEKDGVKGIYFKNGANKEFAPVSVLMEQDGEAVVQTVDAKSALAEGSLIYP